jgi:hypothetical protein
VQRYDAVFCDRRQGELKVGAARQTATESRLDKKSKGLLGMSNPSKKHSTDHEIVALFFWEYCENISTNTSRMRST